jgi:hypothetical protein
MSCSQARPSPKSTLREFRGPWTGLFGIGAVDIQKNRSSSMKKMVGYIMKYLTKVTAKLPRGRRLYTTSWKALSPAKPTLRNCICTELCWENFASLELLQRFEASGIRHLWITTALDRGLEPSAIA